MVDSETSTSETDGELNDDKRRGFWLTAFLVLVLIANPYAAYVYMFNPDTILSQYPNATIPLVYALTVLSFLNAFLAIAILNWKKWGMYGFYSVVAVAFAINVYIGLGLIGSLLGLIGGVFVFLTTRKKMKYFT